MSLQHIIRSFKFTTFTQKSIPISASLNIHRSNVKCNGKKRFKFGEMKKLRSCVLNKYAQYLQTYTNILDRRFPGAMKVYRIFTDGIKEFYGDLKLFIKISRSINGEKGLEKLKLSELELYHQMPKDMFRVAPVLLISALPLTNYIVLPLAYYFPRQLLSRHFWNLQQKSEFNVIHLKQRLNHNKPIFRHLQTQLNYLQQDILYAQWKDVLGQIGSGVQPSVDEILVCKELFNTGPYHLLYLSGNHVRHLSKLHELRPGVFKRSLLNDRATILRAMDQAILKEGGVSKLPLEVLKTACLTRGLNPTNMRNEDMIHWMSQWLQISKQINKDNLSLLLHCTILLGYNQPSNWALVYS